MMFAIRVPASWSSSTLEHASDVLAQVGLVDALAGQQSVLLGGGLELWFAKSMTSRMFARFSSTSLVCFTRISLLASEPCAIARVFWQTTRIGVKPARTARLPSWPWLRAG